MKIIAIIQARTESSRLPKKVLLPLEDKTVLEQVATRVKKNKYAHTVIVATTLKQEDDIITNLCKQHGIPVFRGSSNDVLDRFYRCAQKYHADHIVRITADCPLIDYQIINTIIAYHIKTKSNYTSNVNPPTYPDGEDVEVFTAQTLERMWKHAIKQSEREHVTLHIARHLEQYKTYNVRNSKDLSSYRWTLDNREDYEFILQIFKALYKKGHYFGMDEIIHYLKKKPHIAMINSQIKRNEGLLKSLKSDTIVSTKKYE